MEARRIIEEWAVEEARRVAAQVDKENQQQPKPARQRKAKAKVRSVALTMPHTSTRSDPLYHTKLRLQIAPKPRFDKMIDVRAY